MDWRKTRRQLIEYGIDAKRLPHKWRIGIDLHGVILSKANLRDADLHGVNLSKANLSEANLHDADLRGVNLSKANLSEANLHGAILSEANLHDADLHSATLCVALLPYAVLSEANLSNADLRWAYLYDADLRRAILHSTDLYDADLCWADLSEADLNNANLNRAHLSNADLSGIKINHLTIGIHEAPEGALIGWGKKSGHIVKMLIPANAPRSCATTRKHRAAWVGVLEIDDGEMLRLEHQAVYGSVIYEVGEITYSSSWDPDRWTEYGCGIHFFLTRSEAEAW